jgi:spore maturation protein CgeB
VNIAFFGSSLVSAYWNGAATYYRGLLSALSARGHQITFYEPDAFDRQRHRDLDDPHWARVVVYPATEAAALAALGDAGGADVVIKASGVGVFDATLEEAVLRSRRDGTIIAFCDVDAPATLDRIDADASDPFRQLVPEYDVVFTYGGGPPVVAAYERHGARICVPVYNALDPETHHPVEFEPRFECDLVFVGNRLPDREARVQEFFLNPAAVRKADRFLIGGNGWVGADLPDNVEPLGHVYTRDHNAINCSARCVLNINRDSMARYGFSPPTRIFEAAGAGACIITDAWEGIETFLEPDREVLVAEDGAAVAGLLGDISETEARTIGERARERILAEHTYARRAALVERVLGELRPAGAVN